jgi:hypothetical protein
MRRAVTTMLPLAVFLTASPARAVQNGDPPMEVAAGYMGLRSLTADRNFPPGMFVAIEGNYRRWLGVVGEFSGTFTEASPRFFGDPAAGSGAFLTGPRLIAGPFHGTAAFGQILIGVASSGDGSSGYLAFGIEAGAGVDVAVHRHVALRIAIGRRGLWAIRPASGASASLRELRAGLVLR